MKKLVLALSLALSVSSVSAIDLSNAWQTGTSHSVTQGHSVVAGKSVSVERSNITGLKSEFSAGLPCNGCDGSGYTAIGDFSKNKKETTFLDIKTKFESQENGSNCLVSSSFGGLELGNSASSTAGKSRSVSIDNSKTIVAGKTKFTGKVFDGSKVVGSVKEVTRDNYIVQNHNKTERNDTFNRKTTSVFAK